MEGWGSQAEEILVGRAYKRREPIGDNFDTVVITGLWNPGTAYPELTITPLDFGPTVTCPPGIIEEKYKPYNKELDADLQRWQSQLEDAGAK